MLILTKAEMAIVVDDLRIKGYGKRKRKNSRQNLAIFRLASCYGLRRREIAMMRMCDLDWSGVDSRVRVGREAAKGHHQRRVWMRWSPGAQADIYRWYHERMQNGAQPNDTLICDLRPDYYGTPLSPSSIARRWRTSIKCLGPERRRQLNVHQGRHTFCSQSLQSGRSLPQVRDAAGHSSIAITDVYLHAIDDPAAPPVFDF